MARLAAVVAGLVLVAACGSSDSGSGEAVPSRTDVFRSTALQVPSEVVGGSLVVDYSTLNETRSMMATLAPVGAGGIVGLFVTPDADGSVGQFSSSDEERELMVPMGELSGASGTFDISDVPAGSYELCADLVGDSMRVCTTFTAP